jgi:hypothetical protein
MHKITLNGTQTMTTVAPKSSKTQHSSPLEDFLWVYLYSLESMEHLDDTAAGKKLVKNYVRLSSQRRTWWQHWSVKCLWSIAVWNEFGPTACVLIT